MAGFTAGSRAGGGRAGGGQGRGGRTSRGFGLVFGMVTSLAVLLVLLAPVWLGFSFFGGFGGWGILTIGLVIIRSILRRIFGLRRFGGCSRR